MKRTLSLTCVALTLALAAMAAQAASITGPSTSTDGNFTLSWTTGYQLRLQDSNWSFSWYGPMTFTDLPSGKYKFALYYCVFDQYLNLNCTLEPNTTKVVDVTRSAEIPIDTSTTEAGTTSMTAMVTSRGAAHISVPLKIIPGVGGVAFAPSLEYDSARGGDIVDVETIDDTLGYGWALRGISRIHQCRVGLANASDPNIACLDGMPLKLFSGNYWVGGSEYRTEANRDLRITYLGGSSGWWVHYPNGQVGQFGWTADSAVQAGAQATGAAVPAGVYVWGLNQLGGGFLGNTNVATVEYERFDGYGVLQPKKITYSNAEVLFKIRPTRRSRAACRAGLAVGWHDQRHQHPQSRSGIDEWEEGSRVPPQ